MVLKEIQEKNGSNIPVQIFATDLSVNAINKARVGNYIKQEVESISPQRLKRFFTKITSGYRISKDVREMCVFATHNVLLDPPFSRLDFISCRNLFIYFDTSAQKKSVSIFHYALNDHGYLMIGNSETIESDSPFFTAYNKKFKIYARRNDTGTRKLPIFPLSSYNPALTDGTSFTNPTSKKQNAPNSLENTINTVLISDYLPPSVVINHEMEILQFRGSTDLYLSHHQGKATLNLLKLARPDFAFELRNAIAEAIKTNSRVIKSGIELKINERIRLVSLEAAPLSIDWDEPLLLVVFTEHIQYEAAPSPNHKGKNNPAAKDRRIKKLEEELAASRADALAIANAQDVLHEALQCANEKALSTNEELQTTNEELATSKEEIESANEELITSNQELQTRYEQLNESYEFSEAIIATMHDAIVILDKDLRIKAANKFFYSNFGITEEESIGFPLYELGNGQWDFPRIRELLEYILPKNSSLYNYEITREFPGIGEKILLLNTRKVIQPSNHDQLILLAISDITKVRMNILELQKKEKEEVTAKANIDAYKAADTYIRNIFMQTPAAMCILKGPNHIFELANKLFQQHFGDREFIGKPFLQALPELVVQNFSNHLFKVYESGKPITANEIPVSLKKDGGKEEKVFFNFVFQPHYDSEGNVNGIILHAIEVTEQILASTIQNLSWMVNTEGINNWYSKRWYDYTGTTPLEMEQSSWEKVVHPEHKEYVLEYIKHALGKNETFELIFPLRKKTGEYRWFLNRWIPLSNLGGQARWIGTSTDIHEQVALNEKLNNNINQLRLYESVVVNIQEGVMITDAEPFEKPDPRILYVNQAFTDITGYSLEDIIGKSPRILQGSKTDQKQLDLIRNALIKGEQIRVELINYTKEGKDYLIDLEIVPVEDRTGRIVNFISVQRDITNKKIAESKLIESEQRFRKVADHAPALIWMSGTDKLCNFINKAYLMFTGRSIEQVLGNGWTKAVHPDDLERCLEVYSKFFDLRKEFQIEYRLKRHDGEYRWISDSAVPRFGTDGIFEGFIGSCMDIQDQKLFSEELENQVKDRTQKLNLANQELEGKNDKLQKSEERYLRMVESVKDYAIIYVSKEGIIENWNKGAEKIKGYISEEIIGKNFRIFYTPSDQANKLPEKLLKQAYDEGIAKHEGWRVRKDGTMFWGFTVITALRNSKKNIIGYSKVTRDLTEIKAAEEKIKEATRQLQNKTNQLLEAQEMAHIGSWEWDVKGNRIYWSDELYRIYGLKPQEFEATYESFINFIHPEERDKLNDIVQKAFVDKKPYQVIHKIIRKDGSLRYISAKGKVTTDSKGQTIRVSGTGQDITHQIEKQAELKESEERFLKIFNLNPIAMTLTETGSEKIRFANHQFLTTFGYRKEKDVVGNTADELHLVSTEERERLIGMLLSALEEKRSIEELQALPTEEKLKLFEKLKQIEEMRNLEITYTRKNGRTFPAVVSYETIKIGSETFTITSYQDITEIKKTEELLRLQNERLERMNNELKSFAYISSHDLQEPLRKIQTFSGRILEIESDNLSGVGKDHLQRMNLAAKRMQTLIEDLLAYSRTDKEERIFEKTKIQELIKQVLVEKEDEIKQKSANIEVSVNSEVNVIQFQFRQLIDNLIGNSLKFSKSNIPPIIRIESTILKGSKLNNEKLLPKRDYCHIRISDNGMGFEPQYNGKIFEVFQRLHAKEKFTGTGIGLSIVKKIVDNHNGYISASGIPDKGAIFDIYLPV